MIQKLHFKKYILAFLFLLLQTSLLSIYAQTVTVSDNTLGAAATYTFTYTTTGEIGTGTITSNVFLLGKPTGYIDFVSHGLIYLTPFVIFKVNGTEVPVDAVNFGSIFGSWSGGIQMSVGGATTGFTIPAGATIEVIVTDIITNPVVEGTYTFNWRTAEGSGATTENFSADVTLATLSLG